MNRYIVVTYKSGAIIKIDVPENYYAETFGNKPEQRLHRIFLKEYSKFVTEMNKGKDVVSVGKYLTFSNTSICGKDVLGIDIKDEEEKEDNVDVYIPGAERDVKVNLSDSQVEKLAETILNSDLIDNLNKGLQKLLTYFGKSNVELSIKAGKKTPTTKKKKVEEVKTENTKD